jgi:hypothetical protein
MVIPKHIGIFKKPLTTIGIMKRTLSSLDDQESDQVMQKVSRIHRSVLCFGDTLLYVDTKDFSFLTTLLHCQHNQPEHVICVHAGECQVTSPIAVIPPPHITQEDIPFLSAVVHEHETNLDQGEHVVNYTRVLRLLHYLGGDKRIIETLLEHVHKLAGETIDVRIAYEIYRMFKTNPDVGGQDCRLSRAVQTPPCRPLDNSVG